MPDVDPQPGAGESVPPLPATDAPIAVQTSWRAGAVAALRVLQVRLRLFAIFAVAFLVVGNWEFLTSCYDRLIGSAPGNAPQAVSSNTEYFCPMDPGVLSNWPAKCPICNMSLVRRERGAPALSSDGIASRMQYSPYRLQLAGVRDATAEYRRLVHKVTAYGQLAVEEDLKFAVVAPFSGVVTHVDVASAGARVEKGQSVASLEPDAEAHRPSGEDLSVRAPSAGVLLKPLAMVGDHVESGSLLGVVADMDTLTANLVMPSAEAALLKPGDVAILTRPDVPSQGPWPAKVKSVDFAGRQGRLVVDVRVEAANPNHELQPGMEVAVEWATSLADLPPFASQPTNIEAIVAGELRTVFVCPNHENVCSARAGICPLDGVDFVAYSLADNQRVRYVCDHHAEMVACEPGKTCDICKEELLPRVLTYRPPGQVLAIPASAVVDTGSGSLVYINRGHGMYDGVHVDLGPGADGYVAIVGGLRAGETVAAAGAFLLDAETRLNANAATAYFGATRNPESPAATSSAGGGAAQESSHGREDPAIDQALRELPPEDEPLARRQRLCPVTKLPLGSMGKPIRLTVRGDIVFVCCENCTKKLLADPDKYLAPQADSATEQAP